MTRSADTAASGDTPVFAGPPTPDGLDRVRRPMRILRQAVCWDLRLQLRYQIVTVAVAVTVFYCLLFRAVPATRNDTVAVLLVFSDPTTFGFLFVGVLILFERGANTLQAVVVTPLSCGLYLWSKAISLTIIAVPCGCVMALASHGTAVNFALLVVAVAMSSVSFVFVGAVAAVKVRSVNAYLLLIPAFLAPAMVPILDTVGLLRSPLFYLLPTQGSLLLMEAAFAPRPAWQVCYAVAMLAAVVPLAFRWALREFDGGFRRLGGR